MQSHRPRRSPHPPHVLPPPSQTQHARSPSASSASSTSSGPRTVNPGFTVYPNSSTSTIKLVHPPPPATPGGTTPFGGMTPTSVTPSYRQGYFEPHMTPAATPSTPAAPQMHASASTNPQLPGASTAAAAYAMQRKRSATEPGPTSPPLAGSIMTSMAAATTAVFSSTGVEVPAPVTPPQALKREKEVSKMKIFSKQPFEKALRPPPSPGRRPSFGSLAAAAAAGGGGESIYSSSPPTVAVKDSHSHKPHFLRPRRDKDHTFSSSASNSKTVSTTEPALYSFGPSSPGHIPKSISAIDITSKKPSAALASLAGASYDDPGLFPELTLDSAWPLLRARVYPLFDGEPLRNTVEDLNKLVTLHIRRAVERRNPVALLDDVRDLLEAGMRGIDPRLDELDDTRLVPRLVEVWRLVFGYTTPYLEAVFLPLQQEFKGCGAVLSARESRDFFGIEVASLTAGPMGLDVRRLVMIAFRDAVVLPLHHRLRVLFSRLHMDFSVSQREATEVVGKMLQCVAVLASVLTGDECQRRVEELGRMLKHNWLSRGRTGRNRMGFVGTRMGRVGV